MVCQDCVERHRAQQRGADFGVRRVGIVDRIKILGVLAVPPVFVDIVPGVDNQIRMGLVRIIRHCSLSGVPVGVVAECHEADRLAAFFAGREVAFGNCFAAAAQAIIVGSAEVKPG